MERASYSHPRVSYLVRENVAEERHAWSSACVELYGLGNTNAQGPHQKLLATGNGVRVRIQTLPREPATGHPY